MAESEEHQWQFEFRSDPGRIRELNEDSCLCEPSIALWVVADGMGGHSCGEVASQKAVTSIKSSCASGMALPDAIQQAHNDILHAAADGEGADGMGTTVVAMQSNGSQFSLAWVGDSRAYSWEPQAQNLSLLTSDHSLVERLLSAGLISKEEAKTHPQRHLITQCLGSKELEKLKVDQIHLNWEPNQVLMLCSDGLNEELTESDMKTIFTAEKSLDKTADRLLRMALNKGGQDNISIILIRSPVGTPKGLSGILYNLKTGLKKLFGKH
ncbi:PP2C family protein-serine/threonine phosphatase [Pleionea sediminis]|uniref:PP2C family protein-serine/threonine phosphatase n=1 Tax=Pleionea sediminis TaxID=2569479 RepID=UPI001185883C|nr:protein phosphatase 2C domain-containing protein [Pleionea sediminis]